VGSSLDSMLSAFAQLPIPSREEQVLLGRAIRAWLDWQPSPEDLAQGVTDPPVALRRAGERARQKMVARNMRLVATQARSFSCDTTVAVDVEDLIQEGAVGLNRAAELFDPARGYAFSTYAIWWIRQSMRSLIYTGGTIRIPQKSASSMHRLRQWEEAFVARVGRMPTDVEAMAEMKVGAARLRTLRQAAAVAHVGSLDAPIGEEDGDTWGSTIGATAAEASSSELVLEALSPWPVLQEVMDRMLSGETAGQISQAMGISRNDVIAREDQAMRVAKRRLAGDAAPRSMDAGDLEIERLRALFPDGTSLFSTVP
jgi:RNA polymerase sigma factor (sigma-70 family)